MNQISKIIVGAVTVWIGVYLVVYLVFVLSGDDTSLAEEGGHGETFGGFKDKFIFNVLKKRDTKGRSFSGIGSLIGGSGSHHDGMLYSPLTSFTATSVGIQKPALMSDPFLSAICENTVNAVINGGKIQAQSVAVIVPVRNEQRDVLMHTIKSIYYNSGDELKTVVVVDDRSDDIVKIWPEWNSDEELKQLQREKCHGGNLQLCLRIVRPKHRVGVSGAKAHGASIFASAHERGSPDASVSTLVFMDAHVVPSRGWLATLAHSVEAHPQAIVYPVIDVIDRATGGMAQAGNVVGAFDWALGFRWEDVDASKADGRLSLPPDRSQRDADSLLLSPASPGIMAISTAHYQAVGGFDTTLTPWGQENVELSLRVWLCGGSVIRQPCARVANRYDNLFTDTVTSASNGVSAASVDRNVLSVAEHWMPHSYRELVHQARFTGRVPYTVDVSHDARSPQALHTAPAVGVDKCQDFGWYLEQVYPGLLLDAPAVRRAYQKHIQSDFLSRALQPSLSVHYSSDRHAPEGSAEQVQKRAESASERAVQAAHDRLVPAPVYYPNKRPQNVKVVPKPLEIFKSEANGDPHEEHANKIRETLLCDDEPLHAGTQPCAERVAKEGCNKDRYYMIFGCPRSCGMCGTDGKVCVDFYERKCPVWAREGRCKGEEAEQLKHDCRLSCGHCHLPSLAVGANNAHNKEREKESQQLPHPAEHGKNENPPVAAQVPLPPRAGGPAGQQADILEALAMRQEVAPSVTVAQEQWAVQQASEAAYHRGLSRDQACPLPLQGPHVKLLSHVNRPSVDAGAGVGTGKSRIFCGIYTYEKNHDTNVKATKETWAKRCDGFLAFSTRADPSIPSVNILHEGPEAYDNMWQKSRAIWKYVHTHLNQGQGAQGDSSGGGSKGSFDFFLLGGDDMFYLVENLRAYLDSPEVQTRVSDPRTSGLFLGRRFFPPKQKVFNSGGAGYILDRKALAVLAANLDSPKCWPHQKGFWEDVNVASCLRTSTEERKEWGPYGQIMPYDTRDAQQRERFHPFTPGQHLEYRPPRPGVKDWYQDYNPQLKLGLECCSSESVSFHYVPAALLRKLYTQHYYCPSMHT